MTLTLIGTVHRDREGAVKLRRMLERLRPDEITLEMSPMALRYRRIHGRPQLLRLERILERLATESGREKSTLRNHPAIEDIRALLALPFEYRSASEYAEDVGIPLSLIDLSEISAIKLKKIESGLITYRNIKVLTSLSETDAPPHRESYRVARAMILSAPEKRVRREFLRKRRGVEGIGLRDREMAREIRHRIGSRPLRHLVHIGGWVHLVEDEQGETLYSRLQDLAPRRILLE